jgi:lysophospholipase L1-like esterase
MLEAIRAGREPYRDRIHPSAAGHQAIAAALESAILKIISGMPLPSSNGR